MHIIKENERCPLPRTTLIMNYYFNINIKFQTPVQSILLTTDYKLVLLHNILVYALAST
jgi:hypothetical protein